MIKAKEIINVSNCKSSYSHILIKFDIKIAISRILLNNWLIILLKQIIIAESLSATSRIIICNYCKFVWEAK